MTKRKIWVTVEDYIDIDWTPVDEFIQQCHNWIGEYGDEARFYFEDNKYDDGKRLVIQVERLETDEEYQKRIKDEEYWKKFQQERDKKEYERLKKQFEDKQ